MNRLLFEIVAKRKISEHFKEGMVIRGDSNVPDITRSQTLLTGCRFCKLQRANSEELVFKLIHPCRREQNGRIIFGDKHIA